MLIAYNNEMILVTEENYVTKYQNMMVTIDQKTPIF